MTARLQTGNLYTAYTVWRKEQDTQPGQVPSKMAQFTFYPRGDIATGLLRELNTLGELLGKLYSLFSIILIILTGIIENN